MHSLFTIYESFGRFSRNYRDIRLRLGNFNIVPFIKNRVNSTEIWDKVFKNEPRRIFVEDSP